MMPQFKTTTVMALALAGVVTGIGAQELQAGSPLHVVPTAIGLTHEGQASAPRKPPSLEKTPIPTDKARPAIIASRDLAGFAGLSAGRQKLLETALAVARDSPWLPYVFSGSDPALGGLDCSGAMYYVMTQCGLSPPRTSTGQYLWLREHQQLHQVADDANSGDDPSLAGLQAGDLLFWATGHAVDDPTLANITHVAMYLGRESKDGLQVMINATDGRSYRGTRANGYGVYDFHLPHAESKSRLVGYGPPPGLAAIQPPVGAAP